MGYYTSINEGLFDRLKKKPKPIDKPAPKENVAEKYKFMDAATVRKFKNEVLKEISKICNKYKNIIGPERPYMDPQADYGTFYYIQILQKDTADLSEDELNAYLGILNDFENELKESDTWKKYSNDGYDIDAEFISDSLESICISVNNRLYDEYQRQKRSHNVDPTLKSYFESTNIFESVEFI